MEKALTSKIKLGLPVMVLDLIYTFQLIYSRKTKGIERKPNVGQTNIWTNLPTWDKT